MILEKNRSILEMHSLICGIAFTSQIQNKTKPKQTSTYLVSTDRMCQIFGLNSVHTQPAREYVIRKLALVMWKL